MKKLSRIIVVLAGVLASLSICSACILWLYQPELPQKPR
jgi:cyclic lactone autoinducer peptide